MRPPWLATIGRAASRRLAPLADRLRRPRLVLAHEPRVADDVGGEDRGEAAGDAEPEPPLALSESAKAKRLAELTAELGGLERREDRRQAARRALGAGRLRRHETSADERGHLASGQKLTFLLTAG